MALLCLSTTSFAQETKIITLKDGSVLKGKVIQLKDGLYTLETSTLGSVSIPESEILSIASPGTTGFDSEKSKESSESQKEQLKKQVEQIQGTILGDQGIMADIQKILEDENVKAMLSDPGLLNDVTSFDQNRIEKNSTVQNLMNNPKMQELMKNIQQKIPLEQ